MFDEEVLEWLEDDWDEEHDNEHEWYGDFGNGEAESVVADEILNKYDLRYDSFEEDGYENLMSELNDYTGIFFGR